MLKSLTIQNYAIIDSLTIEFGEHFNVFTGETGAGKSIIVGALGLLTKGKVDTSIVKTGKDKAIIEGVFSLENNDSLKEKLDEALIEYDDEVIVKRVISKDGKSQIRINDSSVTLNTLSNLFFDLVDIHSQKDSQYLFVKKNHLGLLDRFCKNNKELNEYRNAYKEYLNELHEYETMANETYSESDFEYLSFQLEELEKANLDVNEESELLEKEKNYKLAEKYLTNLNNSLDLYNKSSGIKEMFFDAIKELNINDERIQNEKAEIESLYYDLEDRMSNIQNILNSFDASEINIEMVEERLFTYSKLKRKYSKDTSELIELISEIKNKINLFKDRDVLLTDKLNRVNKAKAKAKDLADKLTQIRKNNAQILEKEVIKEASELLLPDISFNVQIIDTDLTINGQDDVEFFISMNKGETLKPLKNVASGGEISRIMLALKIIFAKLSDTKLIIFDEIDTGVSGKAALKVGEKIAYIGKDIQVITITHLAPVAACGNNHYYIYKESNENATYTNVKELLNDEIYNELAFIASGNNEKSSIDAAKALYLSAQELVK